MADMSRAGRSEVTLATLTTTGILAVALLLWDLVRAQQALLFLIAVGIGISLLHASFGFSSVWRSFIRERKGVGLRAQLLLFMVTTLAFFPTIAHVFPTLHASAALGPVGISVLIGAFLFGIGMELGSGCGSGTLYTVGGGHVNMLVTLTFFIIGSLIGTAHLPWWTSLPNIGRVSVIDELGGWLPAAGIQLAILVALYLMVRTLELHRHGQVQALGLRGNQPVSRRLVFGPWSWAWGVIGLAVFSYLTLVTAGYPWSITFAFGLWGAKTYAALGGDVASWAYWSSGYPAQALARPVLADTTSIMDFGIVLGAMLAAALAGKFAPAKQIPFRLLLASVVGGLLLGYGARLAFGCNIGGMFAGIASGSLHGWLWMFAGFVGTWVGVWIRIWGGLDKPYRGSAGRG